MIRSVGDLLAPPNKIFNTKFTFSVKSGYSVMHYWEFKLLTWCMSVFIQFNLILCTPICHSAICTPSSLPSPLLTAWSCQVFVSDSRITVYIDVDTWVLVLYKVIPEDRATYECHFNSEPAQKLAINLSVRGKKLSNLLKSLSIFTTS